MIRLTFETKTCSRCNGSGRYSYCQTMNGPFGPYTCFKCLGSGKMHTGRGAAAYKFYTDLLSVPAKTIAPGDVIHTGLGKIKVIVSRPGREGDGGVYLADGTIDHGWVIEGENRSLHTSPTNKVKKLPNKEEKDRLLESALKYQETLRKDGKPRKGKSMTKERALQERGLSNLDRMV